MERASRKPGPTAGNMAADEPSDDLIWGINSVGEMLVQEEVAISEIFIERGKGGPRLQRIIDLAKERAIPLRFVDSARMRVPRHCRHQGVVARHGTTRLLTVDDLLGRLGGAEGAQSGRILALDSIQDPRNLGSILRSALAAGFVDVVMTRERSVPLTGTVARTSAGAVAHLRLYQVTNLSDALNLLKKKGVWVYGAVAEAEAVSIYEADFSGSLCVVIGGEGKGIRPLVRKQCDMLVTIPMRAAFNSLNASVAAALIMFEVARRFE